MICCGLTPIRNIALGKTFFVCQECKQEVTEREPLVAHQKGINSGAVVAGPAESLDRIYVSHPLGTCYLPNPAGLYRSRLTDYEPSGKPFEVGDTLSDGTDEFTIIGLNLNADTVRLRSLKYNIVHDICNPMIHPYLEKYYTPIKRGVKK